MRRLMDHHASNVQENNVSGADSSSAESEDVKVCDVCGDVGMEKKLAICSRCNDGAEHIYCMRVMIPEVPEGDWLCEECQTEIQIKKENNTLEDSQAKVSTLSMSEIKRSEEVEDVKVCDICGDVGAEEKLAVCSRCSDGAEHIYCMRVMMQEVPKAEWLCETCHNEVESEKGKTKIQASELKVGCSKGQSFVEPMNKPVNTTNSRSSSETGMDAENVGSKVSDRGNEMNHANKRKDGDAGITSLDRQDPLSRESSFKLDTNKGKDPAGQVSTSLACYSLKNQMAPLRVAGPHLAGLQPKKTLRTSFDAGQLSKSTSFNSSKVPKVKQLMNEVPQKPKTLKDSLSCPMRKEGPMGILAKSASFKKPKSFDLVNKAKPSTVINPRVSENARNDILTSILGSRSLSASVAVPVPSKAQSSAQHLNKGNKMVDSNILGTCVEGAKSSLGHSDIKEPLHTKGSANIKLTSAEGSLGILSQGAQRKTIQVPDSSHWDDQIKSPPSLVPKSSSSVRINEQDTRYSWSIPGSASFRDLQTVPSMRGRSVNSISAMSKDMKDKKLMFSSQSFSPSSKHKASTIPELDYIWRGGFQLWRTGKSPVLCEGLQSHLSYVASSKVLEVTKKFPSNIQLEELPRQNVWPPQFHENGPTIDSIGLFFFASDTQSYETHYSKLVENMIKDDLALRGNIETTELLIFASNALPNNFQKWNMFHFLWGVFRVRRKDALNLSPDLPTYDDIHGCPNDVKSLFHPLGGKPLEGQCNDSITTRFPTNNSGAINDSLPAPTKKNMKEKMGVSSEGNSCDVNMELNTSSVSLVHEKGNKTRNIKMHNAEHLIDGGNVNGTEVRSSNMETISHVARAVHKRN